MLFIHATTSRLTSSDFSLNSLLLPPLLTPGRILACISHQSTQNGSCLKVAKSRLPYPPSSTTLQTCCKQTSLPPFPASYIARIASYHIRRQLHFILRRLHCIRHCSFFFVCLSHITSPDNFLRTSPHLTPHQPTSPHLMIHTHQLTSFRTSSPT